jgi:argininosuccinate synthase
MTQRILLAYSGEPATAAAIAWLRETYDADVVTLTLDVGQGNDLEEARLRALAAGALRAHVIDVRDEFARGYALPALQAKPLAPHVGGEAAVAQLAAPLVASKLVEIAAIENATSVAHALAAPDALELAVASIAPHLGIIALPPVVDARHSRTAGAANLLVRPAVDAARALDIAAHIDITFEGGVPVAVNGVGFELTDLIECVSLIAGRHAIGGARPVPAPAATVLAAAYAALPGASGVIRLKLFKGELTVLAVDDLARPDADVSSPALLVNHA